MTNQQRENLKTIATAIRNGRAQVTESFAVGQIMLVTGRPYDQAIKGLALMRSEQLLPQGFIEPKTDGALGRMLKNTPSLSVLISRLDLVPGRCEVLEFRPFTYPPKIGLDGIKKRLFVDGF